MDRNRRRISQGLGVLTTTSALGAVGAQPMKGRGRPEERTSKRPNILVFLIDDHGQWLQQAYGNTEVHTPNLERLARRGVRMNNAYTTCPEAQN